MISVSVGGRARKRRGPAAEDERADRAAVGRLAFVVDEHVARRRVAGAQLARREGALVGVAVLDLAVHRLERDGALEKVVHREEAAGGHRGDHLVDERARHEAREVDDVHAVEQRREQLAPLVHVEELAADALADARARGEAVQVVEQRPPVVDADDAPAALRQPDNVAAAAAAEVDGAHGQRVRAQRRLHQRGEPWQVRRRRPQRRRRLAVLEQPGARGGGPQLVGGEQRFGDCPAASRRRREEGDRLGR